MQGNSRLFRRRTKATIQEDGQQGREPSIIGTSPDFSNKQPSRGSVQSETTSSVTTIAFPDSQRSMSTSDIPFTSMMNHAPLPTRSHQPASYRNYANASEHRTSLPQIGSWHVQKRNKGSINRTHPEGSFNNHTMTPSPECAQPWNNQQDMNGSYSQWHKNLNSQEPLLNAENMKEHDDVSMNEMLSSKTMCSSGNEKPQIIEDRNRTPSPGREGSRNSHQKGGPWADVQWSLANNARRSSEAEPVSPITSRYHNSSEPACNEWICLS